MGRALAKPITLLNHVMGIAALHPSTGCTSTAKPIMPAMPDRIRSGLSTMNWPLASARRLRQRRKNPRPRTNALVKTLQVIFFVRRMDVVVVEPKTHQHGVETERALEIRDDRDRGAGTHQDGFLAPLLGQCALGGGERLHVPIECNGRRAGMVAKFGLAIFRQARGDGIAEGFA